MIKQYYASKISDNIAETPEGYLLCLNVPISKAGEFVYFENEIDEFVPKDGKFVVRRSNNILIAPKTAASFEGKPFTFKHPDSKVVNSKNWDVHLKGVVQNVRAEDGFLIADIIVYDKEVSDMIISGEIREISCGYEAEYQQIDDGVLDTISMKGNHVSLLHAGRCGSECAVFDGAPQQKESNMSLKDKFFAAFNKAFDSAEGEPSDKTVDTSETKVADADPMMVIAEKLDMIVKMLEAMAKTEATEPEEMAMDSAKQEDKEPAKVADAAIEADPQTLAMAEIIAPSVIGSGSKDKVIQVALDHAYAQKQGKEVIDDLLAGRSFDEAAKKDKTLFVAAAKIIGAQRNSEMAHKAADQKPDYSNMTPERLSQIYQQHFKGAK